MNDECIVYTCGKGGKQRHHHQQHLTRTKQISQRKTLPHTLLYRVSDLERMVSRNHNTEYEYHYDQFFQVDVCEWMWMWM